MRSVGGDDYIVMMRCCDVSTELVEYVALRVGGTGPNDSCR